MSQIVPDTKDWTVVLREPCTQCGQDVRATTLDDVIEHLPQAVNRLLGVLERPAAAERTDPARWSDQEYVMHVAQMLPVMIERLTMMRTMYVPTFPDWDQDRAAQDGDYNALGREAVREALRAASERYRAALAQVPEADLTRRGLRSNGAAFTVLSLTQYAWHDVLHHLWDVRAA